MCWVGGAGSAKDRGTFRNMLVLLGHMQVCTSLQTDNHTSTPPLPVFYRPDALPAAQPTVCPVYAKSLKTKPLWLKKSVLGCTTLIEWAAGRFGLFTVR